MTVPFPGLLFFLLPILGRFVFSFAYVYYVAYAICMSAYVPVFTFYGGSV